MKPLAKLAYTLIVASLVIAAPMAWADKAEKVHSGLVVSTTADSLVMSDSAGKNQHSHKVDQTTAITVDGQPAKLPDLKKGDTVQVAVGQDGKVTRITVTREKK